MRARALAPFLLATLWSTVSPGVHADDETSLFDLDLATLMTIEVGASAYASAKGLSAPYAGGELANGGRLGILGAKDLLDSPFATTSYTQAFTQNHQAASIGDVLQYDPCVRVARGFGNFQQVYRVRGLPIFSDDMTYNGLYGILPRQYLAAELIERVEVLRGANAFINGAPPGVSGSLGGSIDAVPKRAPNADLTRITLGSQSGSEHYAAADIAKRTRNQQFGIRVNLVDRQGDTARAGESRTLKLATLGADFRSTQLRVSADLGYQDHQLNAAQPSISIASHLPTPTAPDAKHNFAQPWTYSTEQDVFGTLRTEYDLTPQLTGWLALGARSGKEDSVFGAFLTINNNLGDFSANRFDVIHEDAVLTGEIGLRTQLVLGEVEHQLTLSATHYSNDSRNAYQIYDSFTDNLYRSIPISAPGEVTFASGDLARPGVTTSTRTASLALADELLLLNEQLQLTLGVRQQAIQEDNFDYSTGAPQSRYDERQLTPLIAAVYRVSPTYSVYFNRAEGLLKGDIAPASNSRGKVSNAGSALAPYQTTQTELGIKYSAGSLGGSLSVFDMRKPLTGYNAVNALAVTDHQVHRGLELSVYGTLSSDLKLLGGISLLDTDRDGYDAIGAPKTQANLGLEWDSPDFAGLSLNAHLMHTGSQFADASNTQKVPAWQRLDLGARYALQLQTKQTLTLRANLENVTGGNYWASVGGFPDAGYLTQGTPRALIISAAIDF
jgi:iron complex outermembrane recepter protein